MSSTTPVWRVVAEREVRTRLRDKAFLGATAFSLLLIVGFFVVSLFIGAGADEYDVAVTTEADQALVTAAEEAMRGSNAPDAVLTADVAADADEAEELVSAGDVDAALLPQAEGYVVVGDDDLDPALVAGLSSAAASGALEAIAAEQGVDLADLSRGTEVGQRLLDPNADEADARSGVAFAFALVFLLTAMGFGMTIAQSVAQEKESRVVEILAAAVPVRALLWGKIVGNTALAIGQILLITGVGVAGLVLTDRGELLSGISGAVVAVALTVAAMLVFVRVGARMYERTLLRTGRRIAWREALKLAS